MRLLQLNEAINATEADLKKIFDIDGPIEITSDAVNVDGNVYSKEGVRLTNIPVKFGRVTGNFDMAGYQSLVSLENFPDTANKIRISRNTVMKTLEGGENIVCNTFDAKGSSLENLNGCPTAEIYNFAQCKNLESTDGIPTSKLSAVSLEGCLNVRSIKNLMAQIPTASTSTKSIIEWNPHLPLVWLVLNNGKPGYLNFDVRAPKTNRELSKIIEDFRGKGLGVAMEFIRALRDQGLKGNTTLR